MPTVIYESQIAAPLDRVWAFHEDVLNSLPLLSPPSDDARIERADLPPHVGTIVIINAKGPLGRIRWVAKYVEHVPPHTVVFGEEARFVDEQEAGPFKKWHHAHEFERIDEKTTRLVDRITYTPPYGPIGWIADVLFIRQKLNAMFRYRHAATKTAIEAKS